MASIPLPLPARLRRPRPIQAARTSAWVADALPEIVRGVVAGGGGGGAMLAYVYDGVRVRVESRAGRSWASIRGGWKAGEEPEGLVVVEELEGGGGEAERTWGMVAQRRGGCGEGYLLRTCGVGPCTHFCLVRAKAGGGSAWEQLRDAWLLP